MGDMCNSSLIPQPSTRDCHPDVNYWLKPVQLWYIHCTSSPYKSLPEGMVYGIHMCQQIKHIVGGAKGMSFYNNNLSLGRWVPHPHQQQSCCYCEEESLGGWHCEDDLCRQQHFCHLEEEPCEQESCCHCVGGPFGQQIYCHKKGAPLLVIFRSSDILLWWLWWQESEVIMGLVGKIDDMIGEWGPFWQWR